MIKVTGHADDVRLLALGATVHEEAHDVGGDIVVASVRDLFGHLLCLIQNPNFKLADVRWPDAFSYSID